MILKISTKEKMITVKQIDKDEDIEKWVRIHNLKDYKLHKSEIIHPINKLWENAKVV